MRRLALLILSLSLLAVPATASAADFIPAAGTYAVDTTTLKLTGPGTDITGVNQGGVAVFSFGTVNIANTVTINAAGSRPFKLAASGNLTMSGTINSNGGNATDFTPGPVLGGAGGGAGGNTTSLPGGGPGGGSKQPTTADGGAGGGFGGKGARGGKNGVDGATTGVAAGGVTYGNLNGGPLQGGSGGAGGLDTAGGGGGGAVALFGDFVTMNGIIFVDGGGGAVGNNGASGGGSGGAIVIHGNTVDAPGSLVARGGAGGVGGCCGDGGGGGGGRIAYQYRTLVSSGSTFLTGGASGSRQTGGCGAAPGCTSGGASADATGGLGVVTKIGAASATTSPATGVASNAATLNGTVNPHGSATSFIFQFGRTTAYGTNVSGAGVGSDNVDHAVAKAVGGLAPSTTYHYRVVAIDSLGFVTAGADVGFTTAATPPPPPPPPALTTLASTTSINSLAFPKFTKLLALSAKNLPANSKVVVTCKTKKKKQQKKGCPYKKKTFKSAQKKSKLDLRKPFKKKKLPVGTKIRITITANGFLGKRITYTTRKGKLPKSKVQCLTASGRTGRCR